MSERKWNDYKELFTRLPFCCKSIILFIKIKAVLMMTCVILTQCSIVVNCVKRQVQLVQSEACYWHLALLHTLPYVWTRVEYQF